MAHFSYRSPLLAMTLALLVVPSADAQQQRAHALREGGASVALREYRTTAEDRVTGAPAKHVTPSAAAAGAALAITASPAGLRWTLASDASGPWVVEMVGIGDGGTQAWASHELNDERVTWTAVTEDDAASPQQILDQPYGSGLNGYDFMTVEPAAHGRATAVTHADILLGGLHEVAYYDGLSTQPAFELQVAVSLTPFIGDRLETSLSADGRWLSLGFTNPSDKAEARVYDAWSTTPGVAVAKFEYQAPFFYQYREQRLSGDGSRLLLATRSDVLVYDVTSGAQRFHAVAAIGGHTYGESAVLDGDGDVVGYGGNDVAAWVETPSGWVQAVSHMDSDWSSPAYWAAGLSADGRTFAAAGHDIQANGQLRLHVWDLAPDGTSTKLWTWSWSQSSGDLANAPTGLSLSDDGKRIAISGWGAGDGTYPELMVFDRDLGPTPIASLDVPGSLMDVELSPDGRFAVTGGKAVHAYTWGNGGEVYALDLGGLSLAVYGTPKPGETLELRLHGGAAQIGALLVGIQPLQPGPVAGLDGELGVAPLFSLLLGTLDGSGIGSIALPLPVDPGLVGIDLFAQSVTVDLASLTGAFGDVVRAPIVP